MHFSSLVFSLEGIVALGVLIFAHELGHFLVAKATGITVEAFSLGFGPELAGFTAGGTRYKLSAFPLGGYVKPAGEFAQGAEPPKPGEFLSKPWWVRALVLFAGPAMNFALPVLMLFALYATVGKPLNLGPATVAKLMPGKAAQAAGVRLGDQIVEVDGQKVPSYDKLSAMIDSRSKAHPDRPLEITVLRKGSPLDLKVKAALDPSLGRYLIGVVVEPGPPPLKKVVQEVLVGTPAEKDGFLKGDEILSVDGKPLERGDQFAPLFAGSLHDPVPVEVLRHGARLKILAPKKQPIPKGMDAADIGLLGLQLDSESGLVYAHLGPWQAAEEATLENVGLAVGMVESIYSLVTGQVSFRESVGGPITIVRMADQQARSGLVTFLVFMSKISLMLCIMNLLPIPVLDGGTLVLCLFEGLRGKALPAQAQNVLQGIGIALLVALMGFALYNDIFNLAAHVARTAH